MDKVTLKCKSDSYSCSLKVVGTRRKKDDVYCTVIPCKRNKAKK